MGGRRQRRIDRIALVLGAIAGGAGGAVPGWAMAGWAGALAGAGTGLAAGLAAVRRAGEPAAGYALELPSITAGAEDELLLDDPLPRAADGSRVVRLFRDGAEVALPQPGELAGRIDRWLGARTDNGPAGQAAAADASDELHAALADIRRSLG